MMAMKKTMIDHDNNKLFPVRKEERCITEVKDGHQIDTIINAIINLFTFRTEFLQVENVH